MWSAVVFLFLANPVWRSATTKNVKNRCDGVTPITVPRTATCTYQSRVSISNLLHRPFDREMISVRTTTTTTLHVDATDDDRGRRCTAPTRTRAGSRAPSARAVSTASGLCGKRPLRGLYWSGHMANVHVSDEPCNTRVTGRDTTAGRL